MKLIFSPLSPYARKVLVLAHELNIADQLELVSVNVSPMNHDEVAYQHNPLGKVPTLVRGDGRHIVDSRVICDFLLDSYGSASTPHAGGEDSWEMRTRGSIAEGLTDAAMVARYEVALRPEAVHWREWVAAYEKKVVHALDYLESTALAIRPNMLSLADITTACALGYLDFRFAHLNWRQGRPRLTRAYSEMATRPSLIATAPA